ncbi:MAG TPA: biotin/lipoyl-containing protein [Chloroflexota bacterium]|jgi:acetyl-CoA carboxylase biotin carboxyl carrier protein|nr:biotin/lipoyl-containing protein [Chloroflexota bacterium]
MKEAEREGSLDPELVHQVWQEARDLIKRLEGSTVSRLAVQAGDYRIEIERSATIVAADGNAATGAGAITSGPAAKPPVEGRMPVVAPLLGTFYRSPQPGAKPFVEEGDVVDQGQPIAIVEAMKIMNQVASEHSGRVAEILVKDGDWVEFQQVLMYLEPVEA